MEILLSPRGRQIAERQEGKKFSFIALADIDNDQSIFFDDSEWTGTTFVSGEGAIEWNNSSGDIIPAGTVISLSSNDGVLPSANFGSITEPDSGFNLASIDGMFAYLGSVRNPTTFLAGIGDASSSRGLTSLSGTGLTLGITAVNTAGATNIQYNGTRAGLADFSDYLAEINASGLGSWTNAPNLTTLTIGTFNTTSFTAIPEQSTLMISASLLGCLILGRSRPSHS